VFLKCFSLFSGIGGFDLALKNLGHKIVGACEIDPYARQIFQRCFPGIPLYMDATKIKPEELPSFDLLCAGFPCQAFSVAGKRLGFEESRGTLFFEIARIARQKRPRLLLLENVKGLLSHARGKTFANILATLDELGYDAEWQVLNSKYFVPQNRERIFIIGHLRGERIRKIFPLGEICKETNEKTQDRQISTCIDSNYFKGADNHGQRQLIQLNETPHDTGRIYDSEGLSRTLRANSGGMGSKTGLYAVLTPDRLNKRQNGRRFKTPNEPSFTLTATDKHGISDGKDVRRLTPLECERLQGFPDGWTEGISDTQRYRCLGNAVTVPVVEYILERLN